MKKLLLSFSLLLISLVSYSQENLEFTYLFDFFQKGEVQFKNGNVTPSLFNYELVSGRIHFMNNNTPMELGSPESIEYVKIGDYVFEHVKGSTFYQKIEAGSLDLYIKHIGSLTSKGKVVGYGSHSAIASTKTITRISGNEGFSKDLKRNEVNEVVKSNQFYLKIDGKFKNIHSIGSFSKLFKEHKKEIEDAIKEKNTDFKNIDDVTEIVKFCGELLGK